MTNDEKQMSFDFIEPLDAMVGLSTGRKLVREQEILTPESVLAFCRTLWHASISLDPCSADSNPTHVRADVNLTEAQNGLSAPWADRTYVNPPYQHLKQWMAKASEEARKGYRIVMLCPVRGHRDWWHEYRDTADVCVELKPLKFVGYDGAFPAPLCLLIWNEEIEVMPFLEDVGLKYTKVTYL